MKTYSSKTIRWGDADPSAEPRTVPTSREWTCDIELSAPPFVIDGIAKELERSEAPTVILEPLPDELYRTPGIRFTEVV